MTSRGFALTEVVSACAIVAVAGAALCVCGERSRRAASLGESLNNLRQIGACYAGYAGDHEGLFGTFTWKAGESNSQYADLNNAPSDLEAAANQAVDILRRRAGREDIPKISSWIPHLFYGYLPVADYAGWELPNRLVVSPEDRNRLRWQDDPINFCQTPPVPPDACSPVNKRWPYSSSYQLPPAFYSEPSGPYAIYQTNNHRTFLVPANAPMGGKSLDAVAFPADKAMVFDSNARHFGPRQAYFGLDEARAPILFVDGSASLRATKDANDGWQPQSPQAPWGLTFSYEPYGAPYDYEPRAISPQGRDLVTGHFMYTREALLGRDFGGPEVDLH